ncbi:MAG: PQQ-binding-like beta-propeller repeat protein [Phycisphaerae bacterium]
MLAGVFQAAVAGPALPVLPLKNVASPEIQSGQAGGFSHIQVADSFGARDLLRTAKRLVVSGHLTQAVRTYQHIADQYGNSVIAQPDGTYESVRRYVWALLLNTPAVQHGLYDQIYGLRAKQVIDQSRRTHSLFQLTQACERYFAANAAAAGLQFAAARQFERGRFETAARLWRQLLAHPALRATRPLLLHNAAVAAWLAGEKNLAGRLLEQLANTAPQSSGIIAGEKVNLLADARAILGAAPAFHRPVETGTWPTFEGNFRRNGAAPRGTLPAAIMWTRPLHTFDSTRRSNSASIALQNELRQFLPAFGLTLDPATGQTSGDVLFSFPTCRHGVLYLNLQDRIKAVDINSGYTLWRYPHGRPPTNASTGNLATLISELDHYCCTLANGKLYSVVIHRGGAAPTPTPFGMASAGLDIVCLNAARGQLLWRTAAASLVADKSGRSIWPACIPMVSRHAVFLVIVAGQPGSGMNELSVARLNADSGKAQWTHYLCTITGPAYGISPFNTINIIPAMADHTLYIATGLGADMAINADSGQVRWLHINQAAGTAFTTMQYGLIRRIPPWMMNAPVVAGSRLITMANGFGAASKIHIYNRRTGRKLFVLPCHSFYDAKMLLGVIHGYMLLAGTRLCAVNITTGKQVWASAVIRKFGAISGRPFLTRRNIYVPLNTGLLLINTRHGTLDAMAKWPAESADSAGNLLITAHEVVVVNDHTVAGYARWKDALAYLTGRIKAHPENSEPYLTLAEVAFRSDHEALARQMLSRAVKLALPNASRHAGMADRIFRVCMTFASTSARKSRAAGLFYLQKASTIARVPRQQVQWRMAMVHCYLAQSRPRRAITLLEQILAQAQLRAAPVNYRGVIVAAATAARAMIQTDIIKKFGIPVYAPWETRAQELLTQAQTTQSAAPLEQIVWQYPNSMAAWQAARLLAGHFAGGNHWAEDYDMLLKARSALHLTKSDRAWELSRRCSALVHLRHWNQALVLARRGAARFAAYQWTRGQNKWTFAHYAQHIKQTAPWGALERRAILNAKIGSSLTMSGAIPGTLLQPLENTPRFRRYDLFLIGQKANGGYRISARRTGDLKPLWTCLIPGAKRALLIGYLKKLVILATADQMLAVHTRTGKLAWTDSLLPTAGQHGFLTPLAKAPMPGMQRMVMIQKRIMIYGGFPGYNIIPPQLAAQWRATFVARWLGATTYHFIKLLPDGLVVVGHSDLMLYHPRTGKPVWEQPAALRKYGNISLVRQTGHYLAAAMHLPIDHVVLINRRTGQEVGVLPTDPTARFYWMRADPAGRLLLCGQHGVAMFDPAISMSAPIWSRNGLHDSYPTAASLSVDGLIVPSATGMTCLDVTNGAIRWNQPGLNAGLTSSGLIWMQTALNDNTLVMLTPRNIMAIATRTGDIAWKAEFVMQARPPLTSAQIGDPDIVAMAQGPIGPTGKVMDMYVINQKDRQGRLDNGSIVLDQQFTRSRHDAEAPDVESWLLVNGGILLEVNGVIFYCHT